MIRSQKIDIKRLALLKKIVLLVVLFLGVSITNASSIGKSLILSKVDAKQIFQMPLRDWLLNLEKASSVGMLKYAQASEYEYTMFMPMESQSVVHVVTPSYTQENQQSPFKVTVTDYFYAGMANSLKSLSKIDKLNLIKEWSQELRPDYTLFVEMEDTPVEFIVTFKLFQKGVFPQLDSRSIETNGCWQECVK